MRAGSDQVRLRMVSDRVGPSLAAETTEAIRIRPGDRAVWIDLSLDDREVRRWRSEAANAGLPVDAWLALQAEWSLVRSYLEQANATVTPHELVEAARAASAGALPPTDELRRWCRQLSGASTAAVPRDELPTVVVPERLVAQLQPARRAGELIGYASSGSAREAAELDLAAAYAGLTLEAWAYRVALRLAAA
jgi:hypothetical protein